MHDTKSTSKEAKALVGSLSHENDTKSFVGRAASESERTSQHETFFTTQWQHKKSIAWKRQLDDVSGVTEKLYVALPLRLFVLMASGMEISLANEASSRVKRHKTLGKTKPSDWGCLFFK